jgi:hypothetical protein
MAIRLLSGLLEPTDSRAEQLGFDAHTQTDENREGSSKSIYTPFGEWLAVS